MWLAKETVGKVPPKGGTIDPRSSAVESPPDEDMVNVLLIGGTRLLQESVVHLLDDTRFSVARCVENLDRAVDCLREYPDGFHMLIFQLVDFNDALFFERLSEIRRTLPKLRIVLLAWPIKDLTFLNHSYEVGIDGYLESTTSQEGFRESLDHVVSGKRIFPSRLKEAAQATRQSNRDRSAAATGLSARELQILRHLASGQANKVIANDLEITEATVKVHVKGILRKIGATNRTQAAIWAIHNGLRPIYVGDRDTVN